MNLSLSLKAASALAVVMSVTSVPSLAASISGLFNTGTNASNVALAGGDGVSDSHYVIQSSTSPGFAGQQAVTYVHPAYAANDANSRWISLSSSGSPGSNITTYRTTFDLSGLDPLTAMITGRWGTDNSGSILLNGANTGIPTNSFGVLSNFSLSSGFVTGVNTLDFVVTDSGAPTALRVDDLAGTATAVSAVPEPETYALLLAGLGVLGFAARRRKQKAAA